VYVRDLGVTAKVVEGPDAEGRVILERGAWRIQSRADQCFAPDEAPTGPPAKVKVGRGVASLPEVEPGLSIDVRGMDQEEALRGVEEGLDRAIVAGLSDVRIIHGVGRGILREAIARALRDHPGVAESRLGGHGEGGRGVTIARLR
jgi:DNA mismatch repair protein MutS2